MFNRIHLKFGTAGLIISIVALVAALGGGAYAASGGLSGKQKKEVEKISKRFAGKPGANGATGLAGPAGAPGAKGTAGTNGSNGANGTAGTNGANGTSVTNTAILAGPGEAKCNHQGGAEFKVGTGAATTACNGVTGFTETLPKGKTETGTFAQTAFNLPFPGDVWIPISFSIPVPSESEEAVFLDQAETEAEANVVCTGTVAKPTAPEGTLCVYTSQESNANIESPLFVFNNAVGYQTTGTVLRFGVEAEPAEFQMNGSWAVTAE